MVVGLVSVPTGAFAEIEQAPEAPTSPGSTFAGAVAEMPDGEPRLWYVVNSQNDAPAYLAEIDPLTTELVETYDLPSDVAGSWGVDVADDGTVYLGSHVGGLLFRLPYGAQEVEEIGQPRADTSFLWRVSVADNGHVVTGTFEGFGRDGGTTPPAHLVAWDPENEQWNDYGTFGEQYTYVRSVETVGNTAYVGLGPEAALFTVDLSTGESDEIELPAEVADCSFTYDMSWSGQELFVHFRCPDPRDVGYRLDVETKTWLGPIANYRGQDVTRTLPDGSVFMVAGGRLQQFDGETLESTGIAASYSVGLDWIEDPETGEAVVVGGTQGGGVLIYNPTLGSGYRTYPSPDPTPVVIPRIQDHGGIPLRATTVSAAAYGRAADGSPRLWYAPTGDPAYLAEVDPMSREIINTYPMPGTIGSWGVATAPDGSVYVTSYVGGQMWRLPPGGEELQSLGRPLPTTSFLWRADVDDSGRVYTGTFEGYASGSDRAAHLTAWDPESEQWHDYGSFGEEYQYVRTVSVVGKTAYVGLGSQAAMFEVDLESGTKTEISLPEGITNCSFVRETDEAAGLLFVRIAKCDEVDSAGFVYDPETGEWIDEIPEYYGQDVFQAERDGHVYLAAAGELNAYDVSAGTLTTTNFQLSSGRGIGATDQGLLFGADVDGSVWHYDPATGDGTRSQPDGLEGTPVKTRRIATGPDGRIYATGYFSGGLASFDTESDAWEFNSWRHQGEQMVTHDGLLYIGVYPGAEIYSFNPFEEFGKGNPEPVFSLDGQDRPIAMASAGEYLAVGTVAEYGQLDGMVALYNPDTEEIHEFREIVGEQSISALAYRDGVLYGGTSDRGGGGTTPTNSQAQIFAIDVETKKVLWIKDAPEAHKQVSALTVDDDGYLWGVTVGTVFRADAESGEIVRAVEYFPENWPDRASTYSRLGSIYIDDADGHVYASTSGNALRIDPQTWENTAPPLVQGLTVVQHPSGAAYWHVDQELFEGRWRPNDDAELLQFLVTNYADSGVMPETLERRARQHLEVSLKLIEREKMRAAEKVLDRLISVIDEVDFNVAHEARMIDVANRLTSS